jgi:uncharacterized protein (DUF697 family)
MADPTHRDLPQTGTALTVAATPDQESPAIEPPVIWLLGKVQTGKSSIVQGLTGADRAEVGAGFRACTRTAALFPFPQDQPVVQFLDTRGLGEVQYDPADDLAFAMARAQLVCCVVKAMDSDLSAVLSVLRTIRDQHPDWPVIVAQTTLHEGYLPGQAHVMPYPYTANAIPSPIASPATMPTAVQRALDRQRQLFASLPGRAPIVFVPIDFTQAGDGYEPRHYGLSALLDAIEHTAPIGLAASLREASKAAAQPAAQAKRLQLHRNIQRHAMAAAAVDVVPFAGLIGVPGIQAALLRTLALDYDVTWDRRAMSEFAGALGIGTLAWLASGFGLRQLVKLVPVYGQTVGAAAAAASSYASTYALGQAALAYLDWRLDGETGDNKVVETYRRALSEALAIARKRDQAPS